MTIEAYLLALVAALLFLAAVVVLTWQEQR
jgi:hypothetical protein